MEQYLLLQTFLVHPRGNSSSLGERAYPPRRFNWVCQHGEVNWALQLQSSGQQISSTVMPTPLGVVQFANKRLPKLVRRKIAMFRTFTVGFQNLLRVVLIWLSSGNSRYEILENQLTFCKITKDLVRKSIFSLTDAELLGSEKFNVSADLNETAASCCC